MITFSGSEFLQRLLQNFKLIRIFSKYSCMHFSRYSFAFPLKTTLRISPRGLYRIYWLIISWTFFRNSYRNISSVFSLEIFTEAINLCVSRCISPYCYKNTSTDCSSITSRKSFIKGILLKYFYRIFFQKFSTLLGIAAKAFFRVSPDIFQDFPPGIPSIPS